MAQPIGRTGRLLRQVQAGMAVYDRHHALVGTVTAVSLGGDAAAQGPRGQLAGDSVEEVNVPQLLAALRGLPGAGERS